MDFDIDEIECVKCGNSYTHYRRCSEITCEEGFIDESDEDYLIPGTNMVSCETCKGTGVERWCPSCGADLTGVFPYDNDGYWMLVSKIYTNNMSLTEITLSELESMLKGEEQKKENTMEKLLNLLSLHGGKIVCTALLEPNEINQAKASNRMFVDANSIGYVWIPKLDKLPETDEEVAQFETWFPLEEELPEEMKDPDWIFKRMEKEERNKATKERFKMPTDKQVVEFAILFNEGKLEQEKLAGMVGMCQMILDRLYENGDIMIPSTKE